jgi:hypothetical protein
MFQFHVALMGLLATSNPLAIESSRLWAAMANDPMIHAPMRRQCIFRIAHKVSPGTSLSDFADLLAGSPWLSLENISNWNEQMVLTGYFPVDVHFGDTTTTFSICLLPKLKGFGFGQSIWMRVSKKMSSENLFQVLRGARDERLRAAIIEDIAGMSLNE